MFHHFPDDLRCHGPTETETIHPCVASFSFPLLIPGDPWSVFPQTRGRPISEIISSQSWSLVFTNICPHSKPVGDCTEEKNKAYQLGHAFFNSQRELKIVKSSCSRPKEGEGCERLGEVTLSCSPQSLGMNEFPG